MPCKQGNEVPLVAGSSLTAEDIEPHIEAIAEGIVNMVVSIVEAEHTLFGELVNLSRGTKRYHIAHRNLHLDYSAFHNWRKQGQQVLLEHQVQSMCAYFDHSSYRKPSLLGPLNDMQYRSV